MALRSQFEVWCLDLTLTRVVFEWRDIREGAGTICDLTLTRVVFE